MAVAVRGEERDGPGMPSSPALAEVSPSPPPRLPPLLLFFFTRTKLAIMDTHQHHHYLLVQLVRRLVWIVLLVVLLLLLLLHPLFYHQFTRRFLLPFLLGWHPLSLLLILCHHHHHLQQQLPQPLPLQPQQEREEEGGGFLFPVKLIQRWRRGPVHPSIISTRVKIHHQLITLAQERFVTSPPPPSLFIHMKVGVVMLEVFVVLVEVDDNRGKLSGIDQTEPWQEEEAGEKGEA